MLVESTLVTFAAKSNSALQQFTGAGLNGGALDGSVTPQHGGIGNAMH
jgi:hypothetical protein